MGRMYNALLDQDAVGVEKEFKGYIGWFRKKAKPVRERYWTDEEGGREGLRGMGVRYRSFGDADIVDADKPPFDFGFHPFDPQP